MLYLAIRQMLSRKKQTSLIVLGISFGTMIYIIVAGLQFGFREYLTEQLLNNTAHVLIKGSERDLSEKELRPRFFDESTLVRWIVPPAGKRDEVRLVNPQGWFQRLEEDPDVLAYAPRFSINGIVSQGRYRHSVSITGIDPVKQIKVTSLEDYMEKGSLMELDGGGSKIVLGSGVLETIGAKVGDTVRLSIGLGEPRPYRVVGSIHLGNEQFDKVMALGNIHDIQTLNLSPGRVSEISVALTDINLSHEKAALWSLFSRDEVQGWEEANAQFMQMIGIQDLMRAILTGAILLVAGFGIYNVLSIMISQKKKEIAILRSIGYGPNRILELFLGQGLILGFIGALFGILLGIGVNLIIGSIELSFEVGKSNHLPISFAPSIFATAFAAALIAAVIASFLPAFSASKMTPLDIIREEM
ncbi:MAG: ABC transporter permease [Bdellovibrionales bacterium]|nr:ABC transporter permease [Bdellovibrionales bacterium]